MVNDETEWTLTTIDPHWSQNSSQRPHSFVYTGLLTNNVMCLLFLTEGVMFLLF